MIERQIEEIAEEPQTKTLSERCLEHLETVLGIPVEESKIVFYDRKQQIIINNISLFHQIAQALGLIELRKEFAILRYYLTVQDGFKPGEDFRWLVGLLQDENENFLRKYGELYRIIR